MMTARSARPRGGARRRLAASALALLLLAGTAAPASAQLVRAFTPRFSTNANGDVTLIGNTIMSCNGGGGCNNGRNGTGGNVDDNDFTMVYVDADADGTTFSSSSATLTLPVGATVLWAGLYWGGQSANAARNTVKFSTPAAGYATLTAGQVDVSTTDYQGFADVTNQVRTGGNGTYWVANVQSTPNQTNIHGGWGLIVIYGLASQPIRNLVAFDGYAHVNTGTNVSFTASGFVTPPAGVVTSRLGVIAYEGDLGLTGDNFILNGFTLSDPRSPANNFFNSTISVLGSTFTAKNPNYLNQLGFDADLILTNGILPNGANSATIQFTSTGDEYYPGAVVFATDLYAPVFSSAGFTKTVTDLNGGVVRPGDVLEYTVTMTNSGQDNAAQCVMRDTLPANSAYVPGSLQVASGPNPGVKTDGVGDDQMEYVAASRSVVARLGTGANGASGGQINIAAVTSVKFRVTVNGPAPSGTVVSNQATLAFTAAQSGVAFSTRSDGDAATPGSQPTTVTVTGARITGTVFEDANYGGGAGRSLAASGGVGRPNVRVELYSSGGAFLQADTTDAAGLYLFDGWGAGSYVVRVVESMVGSARAGAVAGLLPVMTWRADGSSGAAVAVTDRVGGENPAIADAGMNTTAATLASLTTVAATAQAITPLTLAAADFGGLDFGFNFDTIVNANPAGRGSLRQFILNSNALGNGGLAQVGCTAGVETSIFMVSDGGAHPGLRAGLANLLSNGVARIVLTSALPALTDASTRIDGSTQTADVGNTNATVLGTGGIVGEDLLAFGTVAGPEVELRDGAGLAIGVDLQGTSQSLASVAVMGFGNAVASDVNADVRVGAAAASAVIENCVIGTPAASWADSGAVVRSGGDHVRVIGGDNGIVRNSLIGFGAGSGIALTGASNGWLVLQCEIRGNAIGNPARSGVAVEGSSGATARQCLVTAQEGPGLDLATSTGTATLENLTVSRNGVGNGAGAVTCGIRIGGSGSRVDRCRVRDNYGAGLMAVSGAANDVFTRSTFSGDGTITGNGGSAATAQIGIDLLKAADNTSTGTAPFVTVNDLNDADAGANGLLNYPVLESAVLANGSFTLIGWARPGSTIELFVSDGDASGFGEGVTYVTTLTEGSAADLDASSSAYASPMNGLAQGVDNTNRFRFTIAAPPGVAAGAKLTATATVAGTGTSEFSGVVAVATGVSVSGFAYQDLNHDLGRDPGEAGTGAAIWMKLVLSGGGSARQVVSADPVTGAYSFTFVNAALYDVVLDDNASAADVSAAYPAGWIGTQNPSGVRAGLNVGATDVANENLGLWHGSRIDGRVFRDDGTGGVANDGVAQVGEAGVAATRVRLTSAPCAGGACDSTLTDGGGHYTLWLPFVAAGSAASIAEVNPGGWLSTGGAAGTTGGAYSRASDATSFTAAAGRTDTGVEFGDVPPNAFAAPGAQTVAAGAIAAYRHTFVAGSAGSVSFGTAQTPSPVIPGWSVQLYRDLNCNGTVDAGEPAIAGPLAVSAGQSVCLVARHAAPAGAPSGARETATLSASFVYTGAAPALGSGSTLDDITSVITAGTGLVITKSVDRASAKPGDLLTYTIQYSNLGSQPVSSIVIDDATPAWTAFNSALCAVPGGGITGCTLSAAPAVGGSGPVRWTLAGALAPGASGSVSFVVKVQ